MDAIEQARKNLHERISALPEDIQDAFGCLIANYDTLVRICREKSSRKKKASKLSISPDKKK